MSHLFLRRLPALSGAACLCALALSACGGGGSGVALPTATPIGTPTTTPVSSGPGLLVFAFAPEGAADAAQTDIFSMNPDGTNLKRLTTSAPDAAGNIQPQGSPALSPNRQQIVFVSVSLVNGQSRSQLRVMNADGTSNRVFSSDANTLGATVPTWSPDGTRLAFSRGNDGIFTVNADGTGARQLTDQGANPSWSMANRIAFNAPPGVRSVAATRKPSGVLPPNTSAYTDIWTMGADGSGLRQLTQRAQNETGLANVNPAWSPDGKTLVFNSTPGSGVASRLFLVGADGTNRRSLGSLEGNDAAWSPDGTRIAYSSEAGLSVANADGSGSKPLDSSGDLFVEDTDWR